MRVFWTLIAAILIAGIAIFIAGNTAAIPMHFLGYNFTTSLAWAAAGAAILGFIVGFMLFAPGRVAAGWRGRSLSRERVRLEQEMATLRAQHQQLVAQHERLRGEHSQVVAERDRLRTLVPASAPAAGAAAPMAATPTATPAQPAQATGYAPMSEQPTIGERLRSAFRRPEQDTGTPDETGLPQGPAAPTA